MATLKLDYSQCGGAFHLVGTKIEHSKVLHTLSSQTSLTSFMRKSTSSYIELNCHRDMNNFGLGKHNTSQHIASPITCSMSSHDNQKGDDSNYHEVKLMDANCLKAIGNNVFIKYNNGREMKVKYRNHPCQLASTIGTKFGNLTTPCMFFQSMSAPACVLPIVTTKEIVGKYTDRMKLNQFLHKGIIEENEHVKFTGVWLKRGENNEYKSTVKFYLKKVEMECTLEMSLDALKLTLDYNIPIYMHQDILREDGLRFPTTIFEMEVHEASFMMSLVNMRREIAMVEGRFSDAAFWESAGLACDIDTIMMGWPSTVVKKH